MSRIEDLSMLTKEVSCQIASDQDNSTKQCQDLEIHRKYKQ